MNLTDFQEVSKQVLGDHMQKRMDELNKAAFDQIVHGSGVSNTLSGVSSAPTKEDEERLIHRFVAHLAQLEEPPTLGEWAVIQQAAKKFTIEGVKKYIDGASSKPKLQGHRASGIWMDDPLQQRLQNKWANELWKQARESSVAMKYGAILKPDKNDMIKLVTS